MVPHGNYIEGSLHHLSMNGGAPSFGKNPHDKLRMPCLLGLIKVLAAPAVHTKIR